MGHYTVIFLNERGTRVETTFNDLWSAKKLVWSLQHSKRCTLLGYSGFNLYE